MTDFLSICVPVKNRSRDTCSRRPVVLFPNCVASIVQAVMGAGVVAELVVADYQSTDWPLWEWLPRACAAVPFRIISVTDQYFSVGRGRNHAAAFAMYDNLFFLDADMLVCQETIQSGMTSLSKGRANFPVPRYIVNQGESRHVPVPTAKGNCFVTRDMWIEAGKFKEWEYWGPEDWAFCDAIEEMSIVERAEPMGFLHQWHPPEWRGRHTREPDHLVSEKQWQASKEKPS